MIRAFRSAVIGAAALGLVEVAGADDVVTPLNVHGFLSQAFGQAAGDSATVLGITTFGTTDYRTAALQLSYAVTDKDRLVLQISHERIGIDPRAAFLPDVGLDWAIYEHRFPTRTTVRVGRVPIPLGIFNEIRDVGTILPFYRPADRFYSDTNFFSETLDGAVVTQGIGMGRWNLDVEPFAGGFNTLAISGTLPLGRARAANVLGMATWLKTPIDGLRVGASGFRSTLRRDLVVPAPSPVPAPEDRKIWMVSLEGSFTRFAVRSEYSQTKDGDSRDRCYYGLVSVPVKKVALNVMYTKFWASWFTGPREGLVSGGARDMAAGVNYSFRPNLVVKLEAHDGEGIGIRVTPLTNRYVLTSLAMSF